MRLTTAVAGLAIFSVEAASEPLRVETHYSPAENLERVDVALISRAARTIDFAAYVLTDVAVIDAIATTSARGVRVRLFRDGNERDAQGPVADALDRLAESPNVEMRFKGSRELMHLKSYCLDGRILRTGSANFTAAGLKRQENDLAVIEGDGACSGFQAAFEALWRQK